jgi:putative transcriptional regulator
MYPMTQENFARVIGVSAGTVRNWEQGRRQPTGPARVLLAMVDCNPGVVSATLPEQPTNCRLLVDRPI